MRVALKVFLILMLNALANEASGFACLDSVSPSMPERVLGRGTEGEAILTRQGTVQKTYFDPDHAANDILAFEILDGLQLISAHTVRRISPPDEIVHLEYISGQSLDSAIQSAAGLSRAGLQKNYSALLSEIEAGLRGAFPFALQRLEVYRLSGQSEPRLAARVSYQGRIVRLIIKPDNIIVHQGRLVIIDPH